MRRDVIQAYSGTPLLGRTGRHNDQLRFESLGNVHDQCVLGIARTGTPSRNTVPAKAHNAGLTWYIQAQRLILAYRVEDAKVVPVYVEGLARSSRLGMTPLHVLTSSIKKNIELYRLLVEMKPGNIVMEDFMGQSR